MAKPLLLLVAAGLDPKHGSEGGKGWTWMKALACVFDLEILTLPSYARQLEGVELPPGCQVHAVGADLIHGPIRLHYYWQYVRWCREVIPACRRLMAERAIAGLHHVTVGSFRVLPRYDRLGIPYTLGPLGGGECIPWSLLPEMRLPATEIVLEAARWPLNHLFTLFPNLRAVLSGAALTMGTTPETARLLDHMGARRTVVVFPDAIDSGGDAEAVLERRARMAQTLDREFACVCASRALWWKGIHLAIDFIARLRERGAPATLTVYTGGPALEALQKRARARGVEAFVRFPGLVSRAELVRAYEDCHLFINPTMHDSASSALLEAYACGLPSMTLGLGGAATVTTPETGLNQRVRRIDDWLEAGCDTVTRWIGDPAQWLAVCRAAKARTLDFGPAHPEAAVRTYLAPIYAPPTTLTQPAMDPLLHLLQHDARASHADLAAQLGSTVADVESKIAQYEAEGAIVGYHTLLDHEKIGDNSVVAVIEVKITPEREGGFDRLAHRIAQFDQVRSCHLMSGGYDLMAVVVGKNLREVASFVSEKLSPLAGVIATATHFRLKAYKENGALLSHEGVPDRLPVSP